MRWTDSILPLAVLLVIPVGAQERPGRTRGERPAEARAMPSIRSGPEAGTAPTPLEVYAPVGLRAGETFDAAAPMRDARAGAVLFVHSLTRETAPVIRAVSGLADEYQVRGLRSALVLLHADRNEGEAQARRVSGPLRTSQPLWLSVDGAEGPGPWALNRRATLTLVLLRDGKVAHGLGITDASLRDVPRIRGLFEEVVGGPVPEDEAGRRAMVYDNLPEDPEALRAWAAELAARLARRGMPQIGGGRPQARRSMQRGRGEGRRPAEGRGRPEGRARPRDAEASARAGSPPDDERLRGLLRQVIRKDVTSEQLDAAFERIAARADESDALGRQVFEMCLLMQRLPYATDAAKAKARAWMDEHPRRSEAGDGGESAERGARSASGGR